MTPLEYEIRVSGLVPQTLLAEIEGVHVVVEPVQTVLRGPVMDQAALHGIINRLQRLGLDLIEVRRLSDEPEIGRVFPTGEAAEQRRIAPDDLAAGY